MKNGLLNTDPLFRDYLRFPWDVLGIFVPKAGPVHSYLCSILAEFVMPELRGFMENKPTMSEIKRICGIEGETLPSRIHSYCSTIYSMSQSDRGHVASEVLEFLAKHEGFRNKVQKRLDYLYRQGLIKVPDYCLSDRPKRSYYDE